MAGSGFGNADGVGSHQHADPLQPGRVQLDALVVVDVVAHGTVRNAGGVQGVQQRRDVVERPDVAVLAAGVGRDPVVGLLAVFQFDAEVAQGRPAAEQPLLVERQLAGQVAVVEMGAFRA